MNVTDNLKKGRIQVILNGESVGDVEKWGITLENIPFELTDVFTIRTMQINDSLCPIKISSTIGYNLAFCKKKEPEWELRVQGPPASPETDVNVTVGDDEPPID
jgi:hypothetical protein